MAMIRFGKNYAPECDVCGCRGRLAPTPDVAERWAHLGKWDTPGPEEADDRCAWWFRCPGCVKANRWPLDAQGWFGVWGASCACGQAGGESFVGNFTGEGDTPTIRLADGDEATTLGVEEMPEAMVVSEGR